MGEFVSCRGLMVESIPGDEEKARPTGVRGESYEFMLTQRPCRQQHLRDKGTVENESGKKRGKRVNDEYADQTVVTRKAVILYGDSGQEKKATDGRMPAVIGGEEEDHGCTTVSGPRRGLKEFRIWHTETGEFHPITYTIRPLKQQKKRRQYKGETFGKTRKLNRFPSTKKQTSSGFDLLPEDLFIIVFSALSSTSSSPADLVNTMLVCRKFCATATHPQVLANASPTTLAVTAASWSDGAHRFLRQCADAGNIEACYTLGMILFYCLRNRSGGASLMAKAAMQSHAAALHSLAVIQFNGSGGTRRDKDLKAGVALCVRAATLGHVDAMRELGHCLQDGYGVGKNVYEGRKLLLEANAREAAAAVAAASSRNYVEAGVQLTLSSAAMSCRLGRHNSTPVNSNTAHTRQRSTGEEIESPTCEALDQQQVYKLIEGGSCSLLSDFGCAVPTPKLHIANKFLVDWFDCQPPVSGLRLCSHGNCGRPETRRHEFRRCSACGCVNYCSRACQALDWKIRHKYDCQPVPDWEDRQDNDIEEDDQIAFEDMDDS